MRIEVVWGAGEGRTDLGAFDVALADAGVANYNLVTFSSVVPPDATVATVGTHEAFYPVGAPVGVVLAATHAEPGERAAAGLGWALAEEGGVFMEACDPSPGACRERIQAALADAQDARDWNWHHDETVIRSVAPDIDADRHGAVVVVAMYGPLTYAEE